MTPLRIAFERIAVVSEARRWLGTPFINATGIHGVGVDCAQLMVRVYCDLGIVPPFATGTYTSGLAGLLRGEQFYRSIVERMCAPTPTPEPGDVVLFRWVRATHGGIVETWPRMIHAFAPVGCVVRADCEQNDYLGRRVESFWRPKRWAED